MHGAIYQSELLCLEPQTFSAVTLFDFLRCLWTSKQLTNALYYMKKKEVLLAFHLRSIVFLQCSPIWSLLLCSVVESPRWFHIAFDAPYYLDPTLRPGFLSTITCSTMMPLTAALLCILVLCCRIQKLELAATISWIGWRFHFLYWICGIPQQQDGENSTTATTFQILTHNT